MIAIGLLFVRMLCDCFKPRQQLQAEILVLRHQLNVLRQRAPRRPHLRWTDRALLIWLYRRCPRILDAITIVRPETVLRWHRMGFAAYWRWKSLEPRHNFPSIKNEEIPSKHSCKLVRTAEKLGYRRGVPARASRVPNAAFVKRPHDR